MKRELIEVSQDKVVECDNPKCDFTVPNELPFSEYPLIYFVDMPCPDCGENLLTHTDYIQAEKMLKVVKWVNRWFSWICYLYPKNTKRTNVSVHCHDGIKIKKED